jgi:hypothetical protein
MLDDRTARVLDAVVRRESRSLLQYVAEAFPWTTPAEQAALARLQRLIAEERAAVARVADFLQRRRHVAPYLGPYPMVFTNLNFVSLDHLLPVLAEHQQRALAELDRDLAAVTDPGARAVLEKLCAVKREHLAALKTLTDAPAAAAVS